MGDLFHTLPAVAEMAASCPGVSVDWLVDKQFEDIPQWSRYINRTYSVPLRQLKKKNRRVNFLSIYRVLKSINANQYDVLIDAQGLLKSALISRLVSAKERHGYDKDSIRESLASCFYSRRHSVSRELHAINRIRQLFSSVMGYSLNNQHPLNYGLHLLPEATMPRNAPVLCFPCTTWVTKHWPASAWRALFELLADDCPRIQLAWGTDSERKHVTELARGYSHVEILPSLNISEMTEYVRRARLIIGVDTGFTHLAQMFDIPLVAIYGATAPGKTGPMGAQQRILSASFPCSPCFKRECQYNGPSIHRPACYDSVSPLRVKQAVIDLLSSSH